MATLHSLSGRVAIVTGSARGIGLSCARSLAQHGAKVLLADVDLAGAEASAAQLVSAGHTAIACSCDVSNSSQVSAMIATCVERYGSVDILVANAGILRAAPFLDMSEEDFDAVLAVNLKGVFMCCQAAARQMVAQLKANPGRKVRGSIVTMSSINAVVAIPTIAGYNAAKGGVNSLTRCMAVSLAEHGIRVNGVGPGSIATDMLAHVSKDPTALSKIMMRTPLQRVGEPSEIGEIAAFLASDASSYITGQVIYADGGRIAMNMMMPPPAAMPSS